MQSNNFIGCNLAKRPNALELHSFTGGLVFFAPIALLIRTEAGVSLSQFFVLQALLSLTILCCEIPTGLLTDRVGYKNSLVISQLLLVLARILLFVGYLRKSLLVFFVEAVVEGVACCFSSGTSSAYLYSLYPEDFMVKGARIDNFGTAGFIASTLLYAPCFHLWGIPGLMICTIMACMAGLFLVLRFPKEPWPRESAAAKQTRPAVVGHTIGRGKILALILLGSSLSIAAFLINFFYVDKLTAISVDPEYMSMIILLYSGVTLLCEPIYRRIKTHQFPAALLVSAVFAGGAFLFFAWTTSRIPTLALMILLPLLLAIPGGILGEIQNRYIDSIHQEGNRATLLSAINMGGSVVEVVFLFASSSVASLGVNLSFCLVAILLIVTTIPVVSLSRKLCKAQT